MNPEPIESDFTSLPTGQEDLEPNDLEVGQLKGRSLSLSKKGSPAKPIRNPTSQPTHLKLSKIPTQLPTIDQILKNQQHPERLKKVIGELAKNYAEASEIMRTITELVRLTPEEQQNDLILCLEKFLDSPLMQEEYKVLFRFLKNELHTEAYPFYLKKVGFLINNNEMRDKILFIAKLEPGFIKIVLNKLSSNRREADDFFTYHMKHHLNLARLKLDHPDLQNLPKSWEEVDIAYHLDCIGKKIDPSYVRKWLISLEQNHQEIPFYEWTDHILKSPYRLIIGKVLAFLATRPPEGCAGILLFLEKHRELTSEFVALIEKERLVRFLGSLMSERKLHPAIAAFLSNKRNYRENVGDLQNLKKILELWTPGNRALELIANFNQKNFSDDLRIGLLERARLMPEMIVDLVELTNRMSPDFGSPNLMQFIELYDRDRELAARILKIAHHYPIAFEALVEDALREDNQHPFVDQISRFFEGHPHLSKKTQNQILLLLNNRNQMIATRIMNLLSHPATEAWGYNLLDLSVSGELEIVRWLDGKIANGVVVEDSFAHKIMEMSRSSNTKLLKRIFELETRAGEKMIQVVEDFSVEGRPRAPHNLLDYYFAGNIQEIAPQPSPSKVGDAIAQKLLKRIEGDPTKKGISKALQNAIEAYFDGTHENAIDQLLKIKDWKAPQSEEERFLLNCAKENHFLTMDRYLAEPKDSPLKAWIQASTATPDLVEGIMNLLHLQGKKRNEQMLLIISLGSLLAKSTISQIVIEEGIGDLLLLSSIDPKMALKKMQSLLQDKGTLKEKLEALRKETDGLLNEKIKKDFVEFKKHAKGGATSKTAQEEITVWCTLQMAQYLLLPGGYVNLHATFTLSRAFARYLPTYAQTEIESVFFDLRHNHSISELFVQVREPENAKSNISYALKWLHKTEKEITPLQAQQAILSGLLFPMRQGDIGSCFGTAIAIQAKENRERYIREMSEMVRTGKLSRREGEDTREYPTPFLHELEKENGHLVGHPLNQSWEFVLSSFGNGDERFYAMDFILKNLDAIKENLNRQANLSAAAKTTYQQGIDDFKLKFEEVIMKRMKWRFVYTEKWGDVALDSSSERGGWALYDSHGLNTHVEKWTSINTKEEFQGFIASLVEETADMTWAKRRPPEKDPTWEKVLAPLRVYVHESLYKENVAKLNKGQVLLAKSKPWLFQSGGHPERVIKSYYERDTYCPSLQIVGKSGAHILEEMTRVREFLPDSLNNRMRNCTTNPTHTFNFLFHHPSFLKIKDPKDRKEWLNQRNEFAKTWMKKHPGELTKLIETLFPNLSQVMLEKVKNRKNPIKALCEEAHLLTGDYEGSLQLANELNAAISKAEEGASIIRFADTNWFHENGHRELGLEYNYAEEDWDLKSFPTTKSVGKPHPTFFQNMEFFFIAPN